jgi:transcription elongation GreA/GreB family factor
VSKLSGDTIKFGATVTLMEEDTGGKKVWQIVGEPEADAHNGKISVTSPIARALIGRSAKKLHRPSAIEAPWSGLVCAVHAISN